MERNDAITTLEVLRANCSKHSRDYQALDYAVSSLKTDETYHLMYEGEDIYTKADMVAMLAEIQLEIEEKRNSTHAGNNEMLIGVLLGIDDCSELIQHKINALRGNEDDR